MASIDLDGMSQGSNDDLFGFPRILRIGEDTKAFTARGHLRLHIADAVATLLRAYDLEVFDAFFDLRRSEFTFKQHEAAADSLDFTIQRFDNLVMCGSYEEVDNTIEWDVRFLYRIEPDGKWSAQAGMASSQYLDDSHEHGLDRISPDGMYIHLYPADDENKFYSTGRFGQALAKTVIESGLWVLSVGAEYTVMASDVDVEFPVPGITCRVYAIVDGPSDEIEELESNAQSGEANDGSEESEETEGELGEPSDESTELGGTVNGFNETNGSNETSNEAKGVPGEASDTSTELAGTVNGSNETNGPKETSNGSEELGGSSGEPAESETVTANSDGTETGEGTGDADAEDTVDWFLLEALASM